MRGGTAFTQPFDVSRLLLTGKPTSVADRLAAGQTIMAVAVAATGTIAFRGGASTNALVGLRQLAWVNRAGVEVGKVGGPLSVANPSLSPDGRHIALQHAVDSNGDIWILDVARGVLDRFTTDPAFDTNPIWSPDGGRILFGSRRGDRGSFYMKPTDGSRHETLVLAEPFASATDWSRDGRLVLLRRFADEDGGNSDVWALPLDTMKVYPVVQTPFDERDAQFSPDAAWIAYQSNESGRFEVYVQPFPGPGGRERISTNGGAQVRWRSDGRELFYIALDGHLMAVPVQIDSDRRRLQPRAPIQLFVTHVGGAAPGVAYLRQQFMVAPDGQRFLMNSLLDDAVTTPISLVLNWKPKP